jgi:RHH-type proline utilization regulon transcriptional repressor/proline dehydrogenase/delta 1-pyrroline-5-carboxylate dehydrogenase
VHAPEEREVIAIAKEIARLGGGSSARAYEMTKLTELLMVLSMKLPEFQTQLFRFVDVFPTMQDTEDISRHLAEYFDQPGPTELMATAVTAASYLPGGKWATASIARREVSKMAEQFIVGTDPDATAAELRRLWAGGTAATVDLLGEHTVSHAEADGYAERLGRLLERLIAESATWPDAPLLEQDDLGSLGRVAVSIKPSALAPDFHALTAEAGIASAKRRLLPILEVAASGGAQIWFDMERYEAKHLTHRLFRELLDEPSLAGLRAGIVVQAYLKDSADDLEDILRWSAGRSVPIGVRLVKGAYWDTESIVARAAGWEVPVYEDKALTDLNFEHCVRALHAAHGQVRAAFGSHNLRSLGYSIACGRQAGIPDHGYEIQLLHGMAEPVHDAVRRLGMRLRVYAPMGELVPGMAYLVRRLLENTSQESFVRHRFAEGKVLDALLERPKPASAGPARAAARSTRSTRRAEREADVSTADNYSPEPLAEWHLDSVRRQMAEALAGLGESPDRAVPAVIDGRSLQTPNTIVSVNPADPARVVAVSASCGRAEADRAVAAAVGAFDEWDRRPAPARADVLFKAAAALRAKRFEIAALEVLEAGKGWADADGDVCEAIDYLEYYGRQALELDKGRPVQSPPGEANSMSYRGRGPTLVIAPWNFPLAIPTGMVAAALVTGNPVLLKPAEQTPAIAAMLAEALQDGGVPAGAFAFLPGVGEEIGEYLVTHPDIVSVAFTGSKAVGLHIYESAARVVPGQREVRRVVAEMGGKNALIVDSDADLDVAIPAAVTSAFGFAGQRCSALSRLIVLDAVHDAVVERFVEATRALSIGDPRLMGTEMGPVIDEESLKRIRGWQERAHEYGDVVFQGGGDGLPDRGYFVSPTIVDGVDPANPLATEEIFGPVVAVLRARDFEHAIEIANSVDYALTAGAISRSPAHIRQATEQLRAGNVYINRSIVGAVVGRQPFGGHGLSGLGMKAGGPDSLLAFAEPRVVSENTMRQGFAPPAD